MRMKPDRSSCPPAPPAAWLAAALLASLWVAAPAPAAATSSRSVTDAHTTVQLLAEHAAAQPGSTLTVGLRMKHQPKWHTYWINPGDAGLTTTIEWSLPPGAEAGDIQWPTPIKFGQETGIVGYGYERQTLLMTDITVPADFAGDTLEITARVDYLACADVCIPGSATLSLSVPVVDAPPDRVAEHAALFDQARADLPQDADEDFATAHRDAGKIILAARLPADDSQADPAAEFFPAELGAIADLAAQHPTRHGDNLQLTLTPSPRLKQPLDRLTGLLVLQSGASRRAVRIDEPIRDQPPAPGKAAPGSDQATPDENATAAAESPDRPTPAGVSLWQAMLGAVLGGMILNLMPCVFPVLALKITGFVQQAGQQRRAIAAHGLAFGAGVLASFWVIAAAVITIQATGRQLGWGFQLQDPIFVGFMAMLMFAVGLNFAGVFDIGFGLMNAAGRASQQVQHGSLTGSFGSGILATALATPCSAPFMTTAIGYALAAPPAVNFIVLTMLGLGMALPYVLLSLFPGWLNILPKPGPWMETFKQFMAFPMFAVVIYLAWVFANQTGGNVGLVVLLGALLLAAMGLWALGRWGVPTRSPGPRFAGRVACAALVVLAGGLIVRFGQTATAAPPQTTTDAAANATAGQSLTWATYSQQAVAEALDAGRPVFIDFTADWCATCKFNERVFIDTAAVRQAVARHDVMLLKADWTNRDDRIAAALAEFGVRSVPLYVFQSPTPGVEPVVFSSMFSSGKVIDAINQVAPRPAVSQK